MPSRAAVLVACALVSAAAGTASAQSEATLESLLWQPGMQASSIGEINVFRRFSSERSAAMTQFYGAVLGLTALPQTAPGGGQMIRYPVGSSEVKLFPSPPSDANVAPAGAVVGVRLLTFFFADEAALAARFRAHGHAVPSFGAGPDQTRRALAQDPDGEWVELVIRPGAPAAELARFEIGIVAADLQASREFYRGLVGFTELPPVEDALLGATKHGYRHAATTINLWSGPAGAPRDAATGGIQYIVWDAARIDAVARARGATIDRPLSAPGQMRTIWLQDPDGISNYFAQFAGNDNTPPATAR